MVLISLYLIYEAIWRFIEPQIISGWIVIIIAGIALIVDLYTSVITYRLSENNMNMKAAFLHNLSDALASIGVVIAGSLILLYEWFWVDSLITMVIAGYILLQTFKMLPNSVNFLMDATPNNISIEDVKTSMSLIKGVEDVHHIHVWNLDEQRVALEAHVVTGAESLKDNATSRYQKWILDWSIRPLVSRLSSCNFDADARDNARAGRAFFTKTTKDRRGF